MTQLTAKHRRALEQYADWIISIEQLGECLRGVLEFDFRDHERRLTTRYGTPEPGVRIEMRHIRNAMDKHARGEITTEELSDWAAMLLMNDAYEWKGSEENEIAKCLNEISLLALKPNAGEQT
jgi:hypothetical protein